MSKKQCGLLFIQSCRPIDYISSNILADFSAKNLKKASWFDETDAFLKFYRPSAAYIGETEGENIPEEEWVLSKETSYIKDSRNPNFPKFSISEDKFCRGNYSTPIKVEIWDHSKTQNHNFISRGYFTVEGAVSGEVAKIETEDG